MMLIYKLQGSSGVQLRCGSLTLAISAALTQKRFFHSSFLLSSPLPLQYNILSASAIKPSRIAVYQQDLLIIYFLFYLPFSLLFSCLLVFFVFFPLFFLFCFFGGTGSTKKKNKKKQQPFLRF